MRKGDRVRPFRVKAVLLLVLLAGCVHVPDEVRVVTRYLAALQRFDAATMDGIWAADAVSIRGDGTTRHIDRNAMREMRAFERTMNTRWSFRIVKWSANSVEVVENEDNDLYDAIGSGRCEQRVRYSLSGDQITSMQTVDIHYSGEPIHDALPRFESWLRSTPTGSDPEVMEEGRIRFTAVSGARIHPRLDEFRRRRQTAP